MSDRRRAAGERIYQRLLRLFPRGFRDRFGLQLLDLFRDQHRAASELGRGALARFWVRITADAFLSALSERLTPTSALHQAEGLVEGWPEDIHYAVRMMVRRPVMSIAIIGTLALGIGANAAIFSLVNTVLLRGLPYPHADRLVRIAEQRLASEPGDRPVPPGNFFDWKARSSSFEDIGWSRDASFNVTGDGPPETLIGYRFSVNMLQVLGMTPALGRGFTPDDDKPGAAKVVILSHALWQRRYGADRNIIGRALTLNGEPNTVIGVMPAVFKHPPGAEIWAPIAVPPPLLARRDLTILRLVGRLKPGVTREQAATELNGIYKGIASRYPEQAAGLTVHLTQLGDPGDAKPLLAVLSGGVAFVLLIACANVANLLLADAASRRRELAIRSTLGASRYRVVRQMLTESVLMALIGGAIGMFAAWWAHDGLLVLFPATISNLNLPRVEQIDVSAAVFGFAFALSLVTGLLFGLLPAWNVSRIDLNGALKQGDRAASASPRTHAALIVAEVALSVVLLAGALLMVQSFVRLQRQRFGFDADRVLSARLSLPRYRYADEGRRRTFTRSLIARLQAIPGVESVGVTNYLPLSGWWDLVEFNIEGMPPPPRGSEMSADFRVASEDYFRSIGITLVNGRTFNVHDDAAAPKVIVVNQSLVNRFMGGEQVAGRRLLMNLDGKGPKPHEIVGVIGDVKSFGLDEPTHAEVFFPYWQVPSSLLGVTLRARRDSAALAAPLRDAVWSVDRDQPITHVMPMSRLAEESLTFRRAGMTLAAAFGILALLLAALGIFGVLSYSVTRRTREIGVRVALGATRGNVLRLVIREALGMVAIGVGMGLATALALSRFLRSVLYEVRPSDPMTYVAATAALIAVAVLATWFPARRASTVDPVTALRIE